MSRRTKADVLKICQGMLVFLILAGFPAMAGGGTSPADILRMHRDGISTQVLLEHLRVTGVDGRLTARKARIMRDDGVAPSVLRTIRELDDTPTNDPKEKRRQRPGVNQSPSGNEPEDPHSRSSGPGTLLLRSRSQETVWFRRDPDGRTLYIAGTERSSMPSVSAGEGMELPMAPGIWRVKTPDVRSYQQIRFATGRTGRLTILGRDRKGVKLSWQPDHPDGNEREIVLQRQQLGREQVQKALQSQRENQRRRRRRTSRHTGYRGRIGNGYSYRHGFSGFGWGATGILDYGYPGVSSYFLFRPGHSFFFHDRLHRRFHHNRHRSRGFDFHFDLNHDFEADGLRGELRFRSGRSGHYDHFFHLD